MKLTLKQEAFCNYYIETGNASEAYRRAFCCQRMRSSTINRMAFDLLNNRKITARINELQKELQRRSDITKDETVSILTNIARANIVDALEVKGGDNYRTFLVKDLSTLPVEFQLAISSVKSTEKGFEVKMYSKIDAIDKLAKMHGWDTPKEENQEMKSPPSVNIQIVTNDPKLLELQDKSINLKNKEESEEAS